MRKSLVLLLASLTLALGLCPAFAFAAQNLEGGALDVQDVDDINITLVAGVGQELTSPVTVRINDTLQTALDQAYGESVTDYESYNGTTAEKTWKVGEAEYKFVGWYTDLADETTKVETGAQLKGETTLYAKWSKKSTVTFDFNYEGATPVEVEAWQYAPIDTEDAKVQAVLTALDDRTGYTALGWFTDQACTEGNEWILEPDKTVTPAQEATVMGDSDVTLYAKWGAEYYVTFNANYGDTPTTVTQPTNPTSPADEDPIFVYGEKQALKSVETLAFSRNGYEFASWNTKKDGSGTTYLDKAEVSDLRDTPGEVVLYAQWAGVNYTANFQANGGTGTMGPQQLVYGVTKLNANTFTKEGYTFRGWALSQADAQNYKVAVEDNKVPVLTGGVEEGGTVSFYAVWEINKYDLTFDANGGEFTVGEKKVAKIEFKGEDAVEFASDIKDKVPATNPTRAGYVFDGWEPALPALVEGKMPMPAANTTYTAKWAGKDCTVTINMNGHGGADSEQTVSNGALATEPQLDSTLMVGVEFAGWYADSDFKTSFSFAEPITSNTQVYAKWVTAKYEVKFELNGGSWPAAKSDVVDPQTIEYGNGAFFPYVVKSETVTIFGDNTLTRYYVNYPNVTPYRVGYGFEGWYSDEALTTPITLVDISTGDHDGSLLNDYIDSEDGTSVGAPNKGTKITANTTLYAKWTKMSYQVKFVESDGTVSVVDKDGKTFDQTVEYGETATEPVDPVAPTTGKTIDGWFTTYTEATDTYTGLYDFSQPVYGNKTLYAKWTDGVYTVAYNANGGKGEMADQEITYDADNALKQKLTKNAFTRDGYKFIGWTNDSEVTTVAADMTYEDYQPREGYFKLADEDGITKQITKGTTLYAIWAGPQTYTVTFDGNGATNGETMASQSFKYGDAAQALTANAFDRDGYVFDGWNTKADGTGTAYKNKAKVKDLTEDTTLYAQWAEAVNVTFMQNASATDTTKATQKVKKGGATELNAFSTLNFTNGTNKAFKGWNTKADGTGDAYADMAEITVDADTTLYAQWATSAVVTFTDKAETTVFDTVTVDLTKTDKSVYYTKSVPTQAGDDEYDVYTFQYWTLKGDAVSKPTQYTTKSDGQVVSGDLQVAYTPAYDTTFIANFQGASYVVQSDGSVKLVENQQKTHTVLYVVNGAVVKVDSEVAYGAKLTVPNDSYTQVDGYTFTGKWLKDDGEAFDFESDTVKTDLTLTAEMTENEASDEQKAEADAALATAAELLAGDNLTDEEKAALQSAVDAYNALDPKTPSGIEALKAAVETAKAAADASQTKKDAAAATAAADEFLAGAEVSADGSDVATDKDWVTEAQKKAIEDAAKAVKDAGDAATAEQVKALNDAIAAAKANGKGKDASKAAATDAEKAEGDKALADAKALQDDVKAGKKTLADADAKALQDAIDAYNAKKAAGTLTSGDVAALKAAVEKAQKAAKAAPAPVAKKMKVDQKVKKIKATKGKKTVTKNVFAVSDAQGKVKVTVAKKFKKFVKAKANGKVIVTKKAKKGGKVAITITDGKTKQTIKVKVKLATKK